jgi:hypothetical protein
MSDTRTLRLVSPRLTADALEAFLRYQRTLLGLLSTSPQDASNTSWAGRFAFAHARALAECQLDVLTQQRIKVLVSEFAGRRSSTLAVKQRLAEAQASVHYAEAHQLPLPPKERAIVERATAELHRLENFEAFVERYGEEAHALLASRELEIVTLHRDLSRLEGAGGHLHSA